MVDDVSILGVWVGMKLWNTCCWLWKSGFIHGWSFTDMFIFLAEGRTSPDKEKSWCAAHEDSAFCSITVNYIWQRTYILYIYTSFCTQCRRLLCFVVSFLESIYRSADISRSEIYRYLGICCPIYADIKTYFTPNNTEKVAQGNVIVKFSVKFTDKL